MSSNGKAATTRRRFVESLEPRRLLSGGTLDTSFNFGHGKDSIVFDGVNVTGHATAVQSDGKIVEVGATDGNSYSIVRYDANGVEDSTFGPNGNGKIVAHMQAHAFVDTADAVAIQSNGDILVAGEVSNPFFIDGVGDGSNHMFVVRYTSSGALDTSFGSAGIVLLNSFDTHTEYDEAAYGLAIQNDGKIIVAGYETQSPILRNDNIAIARLNTDGSLDTSFNDDGKANIDLGENEVADAVAIDYTGTAQTNSDYGKIVVVGHQTSGIDNMDADINIYDDADSTTTYKILIARFNTDGTPDTSFNGNGVLLTNAGFDAASVDARAVTIEAGGKIVIAGSEGTNISSTDHHFFLARFNVNGSLDTTFGTDGDTTTNFGGDDYATSLVVGGFGQQLIAGGTSSGKFALAAYDLNGNPFTPFGTNGQVITKGDNKVSNVQLALAPNHTIVAAGGVGFNTARYLDIAPDVEINSKDRIAAEGTTTKIVGKKVEHITNTATMTVTLSESVPVSTRVYISIGGTAHPPNLSNIKFKKDDYTLIGLTLPTTPISTTTAYVDIPAGQTSATITLVPVDDTLVEPTETASFIIQPNADYGVGVPSGQTMSIQDNDSPTTTTLNPTADAYVRAGSFANDNYGTVPQLVIKKSGTVDDNRVAFFTFDLSSLSTVNNAVFSIFGGLSNSTNTDLETQLFSVANTSWSETGITWNNQPAAGTTPISSTTVHNTATHTHSFDLTAYVQAQFNAGHKIISIMLSNPVKSGSGFVFNSREASSNQPTLTIT